MHNQNPEALFGWLASIGAVIGLGQLLASTEKLTARQVVGRALSSAGLGASAGLVMVWLPDSNPIISYGLAAALASLGTSAIERLLSKVIK